MKRVPIFYTPRMVASGGPGSSLPDKSRLFVDRCSGLATEVHEPPAVSSKLLKLAHGAAYVDGILACRRDSGLGGRRPDVAAALPHQIGSMVAACSLVTSDRSRPVACSPTSGFQMAQRGKAVDGCTFNGLIVAALAMIQLGRSSRVGIIDMSQRGGVGTEKLIRGLKLREKVRHWSPGLLPSSPDRADMLLRSLTTKTKMFADCDLLIYQACADQHIDDPLGGMFTSEQLAQRDRSVFWTAREYRIPLVWNLAGGYRRKADGGISPAIDTHVETMRQCIEIYLGEQDLRQR